ncbi:hypothetical protein QE152_g4601 [Popillia japonica]|uniref:Uncharacterized protein n=1 Tax=Popillia japonica TaxID=7064 RepID=A0AAW1N099_POPJA
MTAFQILDSENGGEDNGVFKTWKKLNHIGQIQAGETPQIEDNGVFKTWKKLNHIGQIQAGETPQIPKYGTDGGSQTRRRCGSERAAASSPYVCSQICEGTAGMTGAREGTTGAKQQSVCVLPDMRGDSGHDRSERGYNGGKTCFRVGCTGGSSANIARAHLAEVIRKEAGLATSEYGEDGTG